MSNSMIILLGNKLSKLVNISLRTSIGIIKLAFKENYKTSETLDLEKIRNVIKTSLSKHLKTLNLSNVEEILLNLEKVAINNQSIITMEII